MIKMLQNMYYMQCSYKIPNNNETIISLIHFLFPTRVAFSSAENKHKETHTHTHTHTQKTTKKKKKKKKKQKKHIHEKPRHNYEKIDIKCYVIKL